MGFSTKKIEPFSKMPDLGIEELYIGIKIKP